MAINMKKVLSCIVVLVILMSVVPGTVFARDNMNNGNNSIGNVSLRSDATKNDTSKISERLDVLGHTSEVEIHGEVVSIAYPISLPTQFGVEISKIMEDPADSLKNGQKVLICTPWDSNAQVDYSVDIGDEVHVCGDYTYEEYIEIQEIWVTDSDHYLEKIDEEQTGSLTVTIYPSEVRSDARWRLTSGTLSTVEIDDTSWHSSGDMITNIPLDYYTIQFNEVSGWTKPSDKGVTITEGSNYQSGTYTQETGSLTVTIYPSEVRSEAWWKLTSGPDTNWHSSGYTITDIPVGYYTIRFSDVSGWTKPDDIPISIAEGSNYQSGWYDVSTPTCDNPPEVYSDKLTYYEGDTILATVSTTHSSVYYYIYGCDDVLYYGGDTSNGATISYTIPKTDASTCCNWRICFSWDEDYYGTLELGEGGNVTAESYQCGPVCYYFEVCPPVAYLEQIGIEGPDELNVGETEQWQAYGSYSDGSQKELTDQVSWTVDPSDVLLNEGIGGIFMGLIGGEATLKISYGTLSATKKVTVVKREVWFQGTVTAVVSDATGLGGWWPIITVRVEKTNASSVEVGGTVVVLYNGPPSADLWNLPKGTCEKVDIGDKVKVFGQCLGDFTRCEQIWLFGSSSYYLMKIDEEKTGSLTVTIEPSEVRSDARWKLTSGPDTGWYSSGDKIQDIPVGSNKILFNEVSGWTKPVDIPITITEGPNSKSGTYTKETGSLTVTIEPSDVRSDARWKLTSRPDIGWHSSGDKIQDIPVGSNKILFNEVSGWTKPEDISIAIKEGPNSESGTYTDHPYISKITLNRLPHIISEPAINTIDKEELGTCWGLSESLWAYVQVTNPLSKEVVVRIKGQIIDKHGEKVLDRRVPSPLLSSYTIAPGESLTANVRLQFNSRLDRFLAGRISPGSYTLKFMVEQKKGFAQYEKVDENETSLIVMPKEEPTVEYPKGDWDKDGTNEPAPGIEYTLFKKREVNVADLLENVANMVWLLVQAKGGIMNPEPLPWHGDFQLNGALERGAASTGEIYLKEEDQGEYKILTVLWGNALYAEPGWSGYVGIHYDRAVVDLILPSTVEVIDDGDADYHIEKEGKIQLTWIYNAPDKQLRSTFRGAALSKPVKPYTVKVRSKSSVTQQMDVKAYLRLEVGPLRNQIKHYIEYPITNDVEQIATIYDYDAWQRDPNSVYWAVIGSRNYEMHSQLSEQTALFVECPVNVTITDQRGREVSDSGINEIPDATVLIKDEKKAFYLPADLTYSVDIVAYDSGRFNFTRLSPVGKDISITKFENIPITASTKASVDIVPDETNYTMSIDYDGNGVYESNITPDVNETIIASPNENIFDTRASANPYPSISGTHTGTIAPNQDITVQKLYTYPCTGTGGHTESVMIYGNEIDKSASWNGYVEDWHTITFDSSFTLEAGKTYNYEIKTGSYPQIHHTDNLSTPAGFITCSEFRDVNGKRYSDLIPAIRLA